jgi:hypothetical protein
MKKGIKNKTNGTNLPVLLLLLQQDIRLCHSADYNFSQQKPTFQQLFGVL